MAVRVAVFDLDGTVTRHDTFLPYIRGWLRRHPRRGVARRAILALIRCLGDGFDRGRLKSDLVRTCMGGATEAEVRAWTTEFVAALGDGDLCHGALDAIASHRGAGDRLVLLSASPDLYVPQIALRFGFDEVICTGIAWQDGRLEGSLTTRNRRDEEKRRCVEDLRARFPEARIAAYGNSPADFAHLAVVDEPWLVNGSPGVRRAAVKRGIRTVEWRNKSVPRPVQSA